MKPRSIVTRTILVVLGAELLCAVAFSVTALHHERHTRQHAFDVVLQGRSDSLLAAIQDAEDAADSLRIDPSEIPMQPGDAFAVYNLGGGLVGASIAAPAPLIERHRNGFADQMLHGRTYRTLQRDAVRLVDRTDSGSAIRRPVTIVYAASTQHIRHEIAEAAGFYVVVSLVCFLLTAGMLVVLLRRVLHPIQELADRAAGVSVLDPHFEAPESSLQVRELRPLGETLTAAIKGLRLALEYERNFVGNAAHELKTAVAVVRSSIQLLMLRPRSREEYAQGLEVLLKDNSRVEELVAQMLMLARMEERGNDTAVADLSVTSAAVVSTLTNYAEIRGVHLLLESTQSALVGISPERAEVLLSNLITNAIQHSPQGSAVNVRCQVDADTVLLEVEDHGAGISATALPHVFERFYREDVSRSRETGGAGLGLAICKSIVDVAGGTLSIASAVAAGTTVTLKLERRQPSRA